ncbi:MAG: hypothetical protein IKW53_00110 [Clostridia bacterium]|nr:hypothetical protein [Clostridia bacterium]
MKRILSLLLIFSLTVLCFTACGGRHIVGFGKAEMNTTYDGVYITLDEVNQSADSTRLSVTWHNETDEYITFGLGYTIEYLDGEEWKDVQIRDFAIIEIACQLNPHSEGQQSYSTQYFNLSAPGSYRIRTEFYVPEEDVGAQSTYATFEVKYFY